MRSVRARLFVGLSVLVVGTNIGFGLLAYHRAAEEATELQDAVLRQVGQFAIHTGSVPTIEGATGKEEEEQQFRVVVEEFGARKPGSLLDGVPPDVSDGIMTVGHDGRDWRLLVHTRTDGRRFGIAQPTTSRDERVRDTLLQTLVPLLMLVPCLLVLVGVVIQASFKPLSVLAARLDARATDDLRTLPAGDVPDEILPFVEAINRLLGRVGQMFEQRRRFVADAAHELRTPVTALTVQVGNLSGLDLPPESRERLDALQGGIRRVARLLEQLLSLARYEDGPSGTAPVAALDMAVREVVADLMPVATERSIDLGFGRIEAAAVKADPTSLRVLVRNLLDNALRYAPDGAQIDVEVFHDGSDAAFRVTDSGPGVAADEIVRIFEPFVRGGRGEREGTGLGLSIVRSIAVAYGGVVHLANRTDGSCGLVATVRFPAVSKDRDPG